MPTPCDEHRGTENLGSDDALGFFDSDVVHANLRPRQVRAPANYGQQTAILRIAAASMPSPL